MIIFDERAYQCVPCNKKYARKPVPGGTTSPPTQPKQQEPQNTFTPPQETTPPPNQETPKESQPQEQSSTQEESQPETQEEPQQQPEQSSTQEESQSETQEEPQQQPEESTQLESQEQSTTQVEPQEQTQPEPPKEDPLDLFENSEGLDAISDLLRVCDILSTGDGEGAFTSTGSEELDKDVNEVSQLLDFIGGGGIPILFEPK